jgi:hypothetical protein
MTGEHLKIKPMGDKVLGVKLEGNSNKPEPIHFRVKFPYGDVDIVRCSDGSYWVHTRINHPQGNNFNPFESTGQIIDGRVDHVDKHATETSCGDLKDPKTYHAAIKVAPL